ncbi:hypothetical protein IFM89_002140 [Coptis chinensis]|uniref:Polyphenol oxidase C-terminal domain-containing protein n=1 Tax=Coptis chinensis TaxID=261450 RepID=A0A835LHD4_9MAGN|nr:hypothetical protein IFM89_002140 [Coptis chinensis]
MAFTFGTTISSTLFLHQALVDNDWITKLKPSIYSIKCLKPIFTSWTQAKQENPEVINRRNVLMCLGFGTSLYGTSHLANPVSSQTFPLSELGYQPLVVKKTVTTLVSRPKEVQTKSENDEVVEVLIVDGIQIPHNGPIRLKVYIAKARNGVVGSDLGQFAGSLINMPFTGVGVGEQRVEVKGKGILELGISGLIKDIGAQNCDMVAVSLVSTLGSVVIGGIQIATR